MCNDMQPETPTMVDRSIESMAKMCRPAPRPNHYVIADLSREHEELVNRIEALSRFIGRDPDVSAEQLKLLKEQLRVMVAYAEILGQRIVELVQATKGDIRKLLDSMCKSSDSE